MAQRESLADGNGPTARFGLTLPERGRQIEREALALADSVHDAAADFETYVGEEMERHPYRTLALAAGAGWLLGGGLATRLTRLMIQTGMRLAVGVVAQQLVARLAAGNPPPGARAN